MTARRHTLARHQRQNGAEPLRKYFFKRIQTRPEFQLALRSGVGYIYNGPTDEEAKAAGLEHASYGKLHETTCSTMSAAGHHSKTFFPRLSDAEAWLADNVGARNRNWRLCSFCYPAAPRADAELQSSPPMAIRSTAEFAEARGRGGYIYNGLESNAQIEGYALGKLHDAKCRTLNLSRASYKTWFATVPDAVSWLTEHVGKERTEWWRCSICRPHERRSKADAQPLLRQLLGDAAVDELAGAERVSVDVSSERAERTITLLPRQLTAAEILEMLKSGVSYKDILEMMKAGVSLEEYSKWKAVASTTPADASEPEMLEPVHERADADPGPRGQPSAPGLDTARASRLIAAADSVIVDLRQQVEALQEALEAERAKATELTEELASTSSNSSGPADDQVTQLEAAWQSAVEENYALQDRIAATEALVAQESEKVGEMQRIIDRALENGAPDSSAAQSIVVPLYRAVVTRANLTPASQLEVLDVAISAAGPVAQLAFERGSLLSRLERHAEAIQQLEAIRSDVGDDMICTPYVTSLLRLGKMPEPIDLLETTDWTVEAAQQALLAAAARLSPDEAVVIAVHASPRLTLSLQARLFDLLSDRQLGTRPYRQLIDLWEERDPASASEELMSTIAQGRLPVGDDWVAGKLETLVMRAGREDDAKRAAQLLMKRAQQNGDESRIQRIVDAAQERLGIVEWLEIADESVRICADLSGVEVLDRAALEGCSIARRWRQVGDDRRADAMLAFVSGLIPRASPGLRGDLLAQINTLAVASETEPGRVVTTVHQALDDVARRFPSLVVLSEARESARSANGNVDKVHRALEFMGELSRRYAHEDVDPYEALKASGFKFKADISDTAKQRYRSDYEVRDTDGTLLMLGPHLDLGNRTTLFRLYFAIDAKSRRLVIGHLGDHLGGKTN